MNLKALEKATMCMQWAKMKKSVQPVELQGVAFCRGRGNIHVRKDSSSGSGCRPGPPGAHRRAAAGRGAGAGLHALRGELRGGAPLSRQQRGADPNLTDKYGVSPLHVVATLGLTKLLDMLVEAGADVNKVGGHNEEYDGEDPCTPLLDALFEFRKNRTECEAITTMLLRAGADVHRGTEDGLSPLHIAAMWGLAFIIPTLLAAGAEVGAIWREPQIDEWTGITDDWELQTPLEATINLLDERVDVFWGSEFCSRWIR